MRSSHTTHGEAETRALGRALAASLRPGDVVGLEGPLGSGKTVFVRGLAEGLDLDPGTVCSPTFVIVHEYETVGGARVVGGCGRIAVLVHVDAYRLHGPEDLESIGWEELLRQPDTVVAVEWPCRIGHGLPPDAWMVSFEHAGPDERTVVIEQPLR